MIKTAIRVVAILIIVLVALLVTNSAAAKGRKTRPANLSGVETFREYCSVCHGTDAQGNGPSAAALKVAPPDLTRLSARNGGNYPTDRITRVIGGDVDIDAHGSRTMPMWGSVFRSMSGTTPMLDSIRIKNLVDYIQTIQAK